MFKKLKISLWLISFTLSFQVLAAEKNYELKVQNITKNITGVDVTHALAINGSIPAPTLRFVGLQHIWDNHAHLCPNTT